MLHTPSYLTHEDHLKWYVNDVLYGPRTHHEEPFRFEFSRNSKPVDFSTLQAASWETELIAALARLLDVHGTKIQLFFSGGFDSEIALRYLLYLKARVEVHHIAFACGSNSSDTECAVKVCNELGVNLNVHHFDIEEYVRFQDFVLDAAAYQSTQMAYLIVLRHINRVCDGKSPVIMGGEIYVQKHPVSSLQPTARDEEWFYTYREDEDGATYRFAQRTGITLINELFSYTPELVAAWMRSPIVRAICTGRIPGKLSLLSSKAQIFKNLLPEVDLTAGYKRHGYEKLTWTNYHVQSELRRQIPSMGVAKIPASHFQLAL